MMQIAGVSTPIRLGALWRTRIAKPVYENLSAEFPVMTILLRVGRLCVRSFTTPIRD
jgi:hypothetical protein